MATGFLPNRSAAIPQTVEVKHLPSINEAPEKKNVHIHQKFRTPHVYTSSSADCGLTHKSGIEPDVFCSFCNVQVSYLLASNTLLLAIH
jgi:hypothetical protein